MNWKRCVLYSIPAWLATAIIGSWPQPRELPDVCIISACNTNLGSRVFFSNTVILVSGSISFEMLDFKAQRSWPGTAFIANRSAILRGKMLRMESDPSELDKSPPTRSQRFIEGLRRAFP